MSTLSQHQQNQIITKILNKAENQYCADCHAKNPTWASIDFGVVICMNCAGAHRTLSRQITRVRSLNLDSWTSDILEIVFNIGNKTANDFFEFQIPSNMKKLSNDESLEQRIKYVNTKYIKKMFVPKGYEDPVTEFKKKSSSQGNQLFTTQSEPISNSTAKTFQMNQLYQQNSNNTTNNTSKRNSKESINNDVDLLEVNSEPLNKNQQVLEDDLLDFVEAPKLEQKPSIQQQQQQQQKPVSQLKPPLPQPSQSKSANGQQDEVNLLDFGQEQQQSSQHKQSNNLILNHHHNHHSSLELQQSKQNQQKQVSETQKTQLNKIDLFSVYDQKNVEQNNQQQNNIQTGAQQNAQSNYDVFDQAQKMQQMLMQQQQQQYRQMQMNNNFNQFNQYNQPINQQNFNGVKYY